MKIGELNLKIAAPSDLDAQLLEATGCSAEEWKKMLAFPLMPFQLAQALLPFISKDAPHPLTLAEAIVANQAADSVRAELLQLYAGHVPAEEEASDGGE